MHVRIDGPDIACDPIGPVNWTRTTQNARSAIMGESSAAGVGVNTQSRMVLVALLALFCCIASCQANHQHPSAVHPASFVYPDEALEGMVRSDGFRQTKSAVMASSSSLPFSGKVQLDNEDRRMYPDSSRSKHDFIMLHLRDSARKRSKSRRGLEADVDDSTITRLVNSERVGEEEKYLSKRKAAAALENEVNFLDLANFNDILSEELPMGRQTFSGYESESISDVENSLLNRIDIQEGKDLHQDETAQTVDFLRPVFIDESKFSGRLSREKQLPLDNRAQSLDSLSYDSSRIQRRPGPLIESVNDDLFDRKSKQYTSNDIIELSNQNRPKAFNNLYYGETDSRVDVPHASESLEDLHQDVHPNSGSLDELRSLIQDTVRKMEVRLENIDMEILNRHNEASTKPSDEDAKGLLDETVHKYVEDPSPNTYDLNDSHEFRGVKNVGEEEEEEEEEEGDNMEEIELSPHELREYDDHATAVILQAIETRTIPEDFEFWRNVSKFLDNDYNYLSRTKRRARKWKPRRRFKSGRHIYQQLRHRLSITYSHVVPCASRDRYYCMHGGTCVIVQALDIKTCRCPIGFTGVRCKKIDQEYIFRLMTESIVYR